ncbi:hypothetical protein D9757_000912 [Collybiopsis confluens]|uniref:Uncharacterized protein n=1 Tax=Collybiopsis confluens TaxID=2823264 RepID=A0A8H5I0D9_9AGAR|nr:hypothetical protein D9757_000912 [Collybiopsis confluens]
MASDVLHTFAFEVDGKIDPEPFAKMLNYRSVGNFRLLDSAPFLKSNYSIPAECVQKNAKIFSITEKAFWELTDLGSGGARPQDSPTADISLNNIHVTPSTNSLGTFVFSYRAIFSQKRYLTTKNLNHLRSRFASATVDSLFQNSPQPSHPFLLQEASRYQTVLSFLAREKATLPDLPSSQEGASVVRMANLAAGNKKYHVCCIYVEKTWKDVSWSFLFVQCVKKKFDLTLPHSALEFLQNLYNMMDCLLWPEDDITPDLQTRMKEMVQELGKVKTHGCFTDNAQSSVGLKRKDYDTDQGQQDQPDKKRTHLARGNSHFRSLNQDTDTEFDSIQ